MCRHKVIKVDVHINSAWSPQIHAHPILLHHTTVNSIMVAGIYIRGGAELGQEARGIHPPTVIGIFSMSLLIYVVNCID